MTTRTSYDSSPRRRLHRVDLLLLVLAVAERMLGSVGAFQTSVTTAQRIRFGSSLIYHPSRRPPEAHGVLHASLDDAQGKKSNSKPPKKEKKRGFPNNLAGSISSDGTVTIRPKKKSTGSLGIPKRRPSQKDVPKAKNMSKKDRQRTGNGSVDSSLQTLIANPKNENVEVLEAKRGNKGVTIIRFVRAFSVMLCEISRYILTDHYDFVAGFGI